MIDFSELTGIVADSFFGGNLELAGLVIFSFALAMMFALTKSPYATLILAMPIAFVFSSMGFIGEDMLILLIIVIVVGLAYSGRNIWSR